MNIYIALSFNRTIVGLKSRGLPRLCFLFLCFNRTIVGLKYCQGCACWGVIGCFNRTIVGLKSIFSPIYNIAFKVLIGLL